MYKISRIILSILLVSLIALACEGPSGSEGPQGPQGEAGPIGPAGEDGSVMYAGPDAPTEDIGNEGDYYLNSNTGEYYGPKDSNGWGNPIIVLMGEDGQDGADGQDGEDGSQIYSGNGAPDASLGVEGDYYLDKDSYELYGPKTSSGWGSPLNLKGADGNANVTRYIFPGHNFGSMNNVFRFLDGLESESEMKQSAWLPYLVFDTNNGPQYYSIPGYAYGTLSQYAFSFSWMDNSERVGFYFVTAEGSGEEYIQIEIVRIESNDTINTNQAKIMPNYLDTSSYAEVAEYYGFYK
ncbi:hypothetical protein CK503_00880 [Aliifodinibius salipaludis]|uniref:Collagen-like protein n=1 Tax=Fodinibius salipaludis TaxID=2032627 RepID=A0A2A2GEK7_9BACT|nr:hypothetical protein [Aliifodinibius salipaludis]PAU95650.1 hypothetical protein CK503_00880 [Aliifodinibius salipaludis]